MLGCSSTITVIIALLKPGLTAPTHSNVLHVFVLIVRTNYTKFRFDFFFFLKRKAFWQNDLRRDIMGKGEVGGQQFVNVYVFFLFIVVSDYLN